MKQLFRFNLLLLPAALLLGVNAAALAQTPQAIVPSPFVTSIVGEPAGGASPLATPTTVCAGSYVNSGGVVTGDNCPPNQVILGNMQDVAVDPSGNVFFGEQTTTLGAAGTSQYPAGQDIRVLYKGGAALTAALIAANQAIPNFTPIPGRVYTIVGGLTANISAVNGTYHCSYNGVVLTVALDVLGNGCPGAQTRTAPRGMTIDQYGNIIFVSWTTVYSVRVLYVGGAQMAKLITLENPSITNPQPGYVYLLALGAKTGNTGDGGLSANAGGISPRDVKVDLAGNVYIVDGTGITAATQTVAAYTASANSVRMINGTTGIISTIAGQYGCYPTAYAAPPGCPYGFSGDGGPATSAQLFDPVDLQIDQYGNVFIADAGNFRIRVLYRGGTLAGITNPVVGNIYTYAGGNATSGAQGTLTTTGIPAQQIKFSAVNNMGLDKAGNLYMLDSSSNYLWKIDAVTGIGYIVAAGVASTAAAHAGAFCSGTAGPLSTDNFGDGCPASQAYLRGTENIPFDNNGDFYIAGGSTGNANLQVQKLSYHQTFPSTAVGTPVNQYVAFIDVTAATTTTRTFTLDGSSTTEFSDALGTGCNPASTLAAKGICVVNVKFSPAHAGFRQGTISLNTAAGAAVTETVTGTGIASDLAIDNGTVSTLGTGLTPSGVATDLLGNVYVADTASGKLFKGASSGTTLPTTLATGLNKPSQVAVDNSGNVYVADTGNNRILVVSPTGTTVATLSSSIPSLALSGPTGVVVDGIGNIYVADTGNNRIVRMTLNGNEVVFPLPAIPTALSKPTQLALDPSGNLYVLDSGNSRIVEYVPATGLTSAVTLDVGVVPTALAIDAANDIYVADATSKSVLNYSAGVTPGFPLVTGFTAPVGVATDADGNLFVADTTMSGALELRRSLANIVFPITDPAATSTAAITTNNVGNAALTFTAPLATVAGVNAAAFSVAPSTTNGCGAGVSYVPGGLCNFTASFTPAVAGINNTATATFVTNATNTGTAVANLSGQSSALTVPTTVQLSLSPTGTVYYGVNVVLTATLQPSTTTTTPTGTFTLTIDGKTDEPPVSIGNGSVNFNLNLFAGTHQLTVTYSGGAPYETSSAAISLPITPAITKTTLIITPTTNVGTASLVFTANVAAQTGVYQTGTVTIYAGPVPTGPVVCSQALSATYTISCATSTLTYPPNTYTAVYSGSSNGNFAPSSSVPQVLGGGDFVPGTVTNTFTIPQGGVGQLNVILSALYGGSGTITPSCSGLPANAVCRFTPNSFTLGSTPVTDLVQIYTNVSSTLASNEPPPASSPLANRIVLALGLPLGLGLLAMRRRSKLRLLALLVLGVSMTAGLSGCSGTKSLQTFSTLQTPTGNYTLTLTFTGSAGFTETHSVTATFTVLPGPAPTN